MSEVREEKIGMGMRRRKEEGKGRGKKRICNRLCRMIGS
jgi:hypothetical protein